MDDPLTKDGAAAASRPVSNVSMDYAGAVPSSDTRDTRSPCGDRQPKTSLAFYPSVPLTPNSPTTAVVARLFQTANGEKTLNQLIRPDSPTH